MRQRARSKAQKIRVSGVHLLLGISEPWPWFWGCRSSCWSSGLGPEAFSLEEQRGSRCLLLYGLLILVRPRVQEFQNRVAPAPWHPVKAMISWWLTSCWRRKGCIQAFGKLPSSCKPQDFPIKLNRHSLAGPIAAETSDAHTSHARAYLDPSSLCK